MRRNGVRLNVSRYLTGTERLRERFRAIVTTVALFLIAQGGIVPWYSTTLIPAAPTKPDPAHGLTAAFNNHGTTIYIKPWQSFLMDEAVVAMFTGFALIGIQYLMRERGKS